MKRGAALRGGPFACATVRKSGARSIYMRNMAKKAKYNNKPVYRISVDDSVDGMTKVSLVDYPAMEKNFIALRREDPARQLYAVQDEEKRLVRGVLIRADFPVYRRDDKLGEYYIVFEKETIRKIAEQYLTDGRANDVNQMHEDGTDVTGVNLVQWFIKDSAAGVSPAGFEDIEEGSLFGEYHVENDEVWEGVKNGTFKGFSIECTTYYEPIEAGEETFAAADLYALISKYKDMPNFLKKLRLAAQEIVGQKFRTDTTDKGVIAWDGEEDIKVGDAVQMVAEDDSREPAADGDYTLSDGTVITVADGAVTEVKAPEEEPAQGEGEGEETNASKLAAVARRNRFEESYDEKRRKIAEAIAAARGAGEDEGGYLWEAGDTFAVWAYYSEATGWEDRYVRYSVAWNEDGSAAVSDPLDVRMAFVPVDFDDAALFGGKAAEGEGEGEGAEGGEADTAAAEMGQLRKDFDELCEIVTGVVEAVKNQGLQLSKVAKAPAGVPAAEAFKAAKAAAEKGDTPTALEKLRKYLG